MTSMTTSRTATARPTAPAPQITDDQLNGQWIEKLDGHVQADELVIESWSAVGIRLHLGDKVVELSRAGNDLTADGIALTAKPHKSGIKDDELAGTIDGHTVSLKRDSEVKDPLVVPFPGTKPYRMWLQDMILPMAQQDRESYKELTSRRCSTSSRAASSTSTARGCAST